MPATFEIPRASLVRTATHSLTRLQPEAEMSGLISQKAITYGLNLVSLGKHPPNLRNKSGHV